MGSRSIHPQRFLYSLVLSAVSLFGSSQTWLFQTRLFAIFTRKRSFALFCALLRSFMDLRRRSFALISVLLCAFACFLRPTAFRMTTSGNCRCFAGWPRSQARTRIIETASMCPGTTQHRLNSIKQGPPPLSFEVLSQSILAVQEHLVPQFLPPPAVAYKLTLPSQAKLRHIAKSMLRVWGCGKHGCALGEGLLIKPFLVEAPPVLAFCGIGFALGQTSDHQHRSTKVPTQLPFNMQLSLTTWPRTTSNCLMRICFRIG